MLKMNFSFTAITFLGSLLSVTAMAGTVTYVPIAGDVTFFVPVTKVDCGPQDVCITWITQAPAVISSNFTDDPEFNYSDDTNKIHQISTLYYNSPTSLPIKLQCINNSGAWVDISSPGNSSMSVINSTDGYGQPLNLNYNALGFPVYQHRWSGGLLVNSTNCKVTLTDLYSPTTNLYTYKHRQKSLNLRMVNPDGNVAVVMPPSLDSCRINNMALSLWDRSLSCVGSNRPTSIQLAVDETITRASNYGNITLSLNTGVGSGNPDYWDCSYSITVDGVSKGNWGSPGTPTTATLGQVKFGTHTIGFSVIQCFARNTCQGPANNCQSVNTVFGQSQPLSPQSQLLWILNPSYQGSQTFNFTLKQPTP